MTVPTADQPDRDRIESDLATNLLVEAGAGSGKTKGLVDRMLALIASGTPAEQIAAVTFTRKAAAELRERFEEQLETRALPGRDQAFIGTIHAFCGRMLREHPIEAKLDPSFEELDEEGWPILVQRFWSHWLERLDSQDRPSLDGIRALGIDPRELAGAFATRVTYPDVGFPAAEVAAPDPAPCRARLLVLLDKTGLMMPSEEPGNGYDELQRLWRRLNFWRRTRDWSQTPELVVALGSLSSGKCKVVQNRWADKQKAKELSEEWLGFLNGEADAFLTRWREHCYRPVMALLERAADAFQRERRRAGTLGFGDLLMEASRLLRESPRARRALGERFRHLLVDEFQDTDPIQAEICFLLASDPSQGTDWRSVTLRPGALFVVGDPKQSIYRFRRADIQTYELVKRRIASQGAVLRLTSNFRSVHPIAAFVDAHFTRHFPSTGSAEQAPFAPLATVNEPSGADGVYCYAVTPEGNTKPEIHAEDAARVASLIAQRIAGGNYQPSDFLVLALNLKSLAPYARELSARNVPVSVTGAPLPQEEELGELLVLLRALADPSNAVAVVAALEGLCFGLSPADLDDGRRADLEFKVNTPPAATATPCGQALATLYAWWQASRRLAPDLLLEFLLDATGMLPYAAGLPLGDARAGALLHLVELLRHESTGAGLSLPRAVELLETVLASSRAETSLRPGRRDAVRVMNLHKAKGLEARVVILVAPVEQNGHPPAVHVDRRDDGSATGGMLVLGDGAILAQPGGWREMAAREEAFAAAETQRLLYVAATRAGRELLVSQLVLQLKTKMAEDKSFWSPFAAALATHAAAVALPLEAAMGRAYPACSADEMRDRCAAVEAGRMAAAIAGMRMTSVTRTLQEEREERFQPGGARSQGDGATWGRLVHRALEAAGRGREGPVLDRYVRALVRYELTSASEPEVQAMTARVLQQVSSVCQGDAWQRIAGGSERLFELSLIGVDGDGATDVVTRGVADAAALVDGAWRVFDWKTDHADDAAWAGREGQYRQQVEAYARLIERRAGAPAQGEIVRILEG
jgi:ATP-dependent helicase/nuclease subunit A